MFETHLPVAAYGTGTEGARRAFDWGDLVARINVARDVHLLLHPQLANPVPRASFAPDVAGLAQGEDSINLPASADGKGAAAYNLQAASDAAIDHRGTR